MYKKYTMTAIFHTNYWDQVNSWKNLWKFLNGRLCRNKSGLFTLLNVAAYWKSSNSQACAKKLSQILANNIDNGGRGISLRIYVRYCSFSHYPQHIEVSRSQSQNVIKWKFRGNLTYFILYLTGVLTMTNFFALPPNF